MIKTMKKLLMICMSLFAAFAASHVKASELKNAPCFEATEFEVVGAAYRPISDRKQFTDCIEKLNEVERRVVFDALKLRLLMDGIEQKTRGESADTLGRCEYLGRMNEVLGKYRGPLDLVDRYYTYVYRCQPLRQQAMVGGLVLIALLASLGAMLATLAGLMWIIGIGAKRFGYTETSNVLIKARKYILGR